MIARAHVNSENGNLGKVRTEVVKRAARELLERFPGKFASEFEPNKLAVNELLRAPSKRLRNRIAGYVTRLKMIEAEKATMLQMSPEAGLGLGEDEEESAQEESAPAAS